MLPMRWKRISTTGCPQRSRRYAGTGAQAETCVSASSLLGSRLPCVVNCAMTARSSALDHESGTRRANTSAATGNPKGKAAHQSQGSRSTKTRPCATVLPAGHQCIGLAGCGQQTRELRAVVHFQHVAIDEMDGARSGGEALEARSSLTAISRSVFAVHAQPQGADLLCKREGCSAARTLPSAGSSVR